MYLHELHDLLHDFHDSNVSRVPGTRTVRRPELSGYKNEKITASTSTMSKRKTPQVPDGGGSAESGASSDLETILKKAIANAMENFQSKLDSKVENFGSKLESKLGLKVVSKLEQLDRKSVV